MRTANAVSNAAQQAAQAVVSELAIVSKGMALPRGADPFVGAELPLAVVGTRWARVAPGGVFVGGTPAAMRELFGLDPLPTGVPVPAEEKAEREAELREAATKLTKDVGLAVLELAGFPPDLATTSVMTCTSAVQVRQEVGQVGDGVACTISVGEQAVRLVVIIPAVLAARLSRDPLESEAVREDGAVLARDLSHLEVAPVVESRVSSFAPLAAVPIDLAVELGRVRTPLTRLLRAPAGELLALDQRSDEPIALVSEAAPVAYGELEVGEHDQLQLRITSVAGQPKSAPTPVSAASAATSPDHPEPMGSNDA